MVLLVVMHIPLYNPPPTYTVSLLPGAQGYGYRTYDPSAQNDLVDGILTVVAGSRVHIWIGINFDKDLFRFPGYVVSGNETRVGESMYLTVNSNLVVSQMSLEPTEYKAALDLLAANALTVIESGKIYCTRLDCEYASKARLDTGTFIRVAHQLGIVVVSHMKSYTAGIENHYIWDPMYQWFWFIDHSTLYYVRMDA